MTFISLKSSINSKIVNETFNDEADINKTILGTIIFKTIFSLLNINKDYLSNVNQLVSQYCNIFKPVVETLKKQYISFRQIKNYILLNNVNSFMSITRGQIDDIYNLYLNKQKKETFNLSWYSQYMYNTADLTDSQNEVLSKVHKKVLVPLVEYYIENQNISLESVSCEIVDGSYPGKLIDVSINGVNINKMAADIQRDLMNIKKYLNRPYYLIQNNETLRLFIR